MRAKPSSLLQTQITSSLAGGEEKELMFTNDAARRNFLRVAGLGMSGVAVGAMTRSAVAKSTPTSGGEYDVRAFGAKGDGNTLDTEPINRTIEAAAHAGGAAVSFSAGTYLCYSIHLKSNVDLYLGPGATILAADTPAPGATGGYDSPEPNEWDHYQDFGHSHWHNSLIWGEGIKNVSITGPGLIWGKGLSRGEGDTALAAGVGNKSISLKNCHNITLRDFSMLHAGHFAILATGVDNFTIDNLKIDTNRDGIDIDCCRNVRVSNCSVNSPWDDGICLKSSFALGYARPTENVTITNCFVTAKDQLGTMLDGTFKEWPADTKTPRTGRIKCGTESNGGFKNITISNCVFEGCRGLALESVDGALLEDIAITNITMRELTSAPLFLRLGSRMRGPAGVPVGTLRRVLISNVVSYNSGSPLPAIVSGILGNVIEDLQINDVYLHQAGGADAAMAAIDPPEDETKYPDPHMFGPLPAHGFLIRHVKNLEMSNVNLATGKDDARAAFWLNDISVADFFRVKASVATGTSMFALRNVSNFRISGSRGVKDLEIDFSARQTL